MDVACPGPRAASTFCSLSAHGARSSINQLISLEFMFCCGVALRSDATCPTMCTPPCLPSIYPLAASTSRLASIWAKSSSFLVLLLFAAHITSFLQLLARLLCCNCFICGNVLAVLHVACGMWYACLPPCQRGEAVAGTMRVKMYTLHLNHSGKLLLASSLYLSAAIYLRLQSALGFSQPLLPPSLLPPTAAKHWQLQVACNFFGGCQSKLKSAKHLLHSFF